MTVRITRFCVPLLLAFALGARQSMIAPPPSKSLYDRRAVTPAIAAVVDDASRTSRPTAVSTGSSREPTSRA